MFFKLINLLSILLIFTLINLSENVLFCNDQCLWNKEKENDFRCVIKEKSHFFSAESEIKWLQPNNCEILREMIFKFNKVMNVEGKMELSVEDLRRDAFSTPPCYHCLLAEYEEQIIGYCIFNFVYDTNIGKRVYVEEIFVEEHLQGRAIGTTLVKSVAQYAKVNGFSGVFLVSKSSSNAFYNKLGFINETKELGYSVYTVERETFDQLVLEPSFIDLEVL